MGLYDCLHCRKELPLNEELKTLSIKWDEIEFQTKDLDNCLGEYTITEDGRLLETIVERDYIPYTPEERKEKKISPWDLWKDVIEKSREEVPVNHHGKIRFYCYEDFSEEEDFSADFDAYFVYGKLDKIELASFEKFRSRHYDLEQWAENYKKEQKHPWTIFKKYSGWNWAWRKIDRGLYKISNVCDTLRRFIIRRCL